MIPETRNLRLYERGKRSMIGRIIGWMEWDDDYGRGCDVEPIVFVNVEQRARLIDISSGDYEVKGWPE